MASDRSGFDVQAEPTHTRRDEWRVSVTRNGYQWHSLSITFDSQERAERVAAFLRDELAYDAERMRREIEEMV